MKLIFAGLLSAFSVCAFAGVGNCESGSFPRMPNIQYTQDWQMTPLSIKATSNGYHGPMYIPTLDMSMYGVKLGEPYTDAGVDGIAAVLESKYRFSNVSGRLDSDEGVRFKKYTMTSGSSLVISGFYDIHKERTIFTSIWRTSYEGNIDWNSLKRNVVSKFGPGIVAAGPGKPNYAARLRNGDGGWYYNFASSCEGSDDCQGTVAFNYKNRFTENSSGGVCVNRSYDLSLRKVDVERRIIANEKAESQMAARRAADKLKLIKPVL